MDDLPNMACGFGNEKLTISYASDDTNSENETQNYPEISTTSAQVAIGHHKNTDKERTYAVYGLNLHGTFLNGKYADFTSERSPVACVDEIEVLLNEDIEPWSQTFEFKNKEVFDCFKDLIRSSGISAAQNSLHNRPVDEVTTTQFFGIATIESIDMAHCSLTCSSICLSEYAVEHLKDIDSLISENELEEAKNKCKTFFELYGSHVFLGRLRLGGLYFVAHLMERKVDSVLDIKARVKSAHEKFLKEHDFTIKKESSQGDLMDESIKSLCFKIGGGKNLADFKQWKLSLGISNTWSIVDRVDLNHSLEHFSGIWTVIESNRKDFQNSRQLASFVSRVWLTALKQNDPDSALSADLKLSMSEIESLLEPTEIEHMHQFNLCGFIQFLDNILAHIESKKEKFGYGFVLSLELLERQFFFKFLENVSKMQSQGDQFHKLQILVLRVLDNYELKDIPSKICTLLKSWFLQREISFQGILRKTPLRCMNDYLIALEETILPEWLFLENYPVPLVNQHDISSSICREFEDTSKQLLESLDSIETLKLIVALLGIQYDFKNKMVGMSFSARTMQSFVWQAKESAIRYKRQEKKDKTEYQAYLFIHIVSSLDAIHGSPTESYFEIINLLKQRKLQFESKVEQIVALRYKSNMEMHVLASKYMSLCGFEWPYFENIWNKGEKHITNELQTHFSKKDGRTPQQENTQKLIRLFKIDQYFPELMNIETAIKLSGELFKDPSNIKDFPLTVLRKIISLDFNFREFTIPKMERLKIHPSDILVALFYISDPFLRQLLVSKISICQLAVPFIFSHYERDTLFMQMWALRGVIREGNAKSVVTENTKAVSFIRIGNTNFPSSKSQLLNKFLRGYHDGHNTFFHKDCPHGSCNRKLANGSIEVAWYTPKSSVKQPQATTIEESISVYNLRGDVFEYERQLDVLLQISDVIVVLANFQTIKDEKGMNLLKGIHDKNITVILMTDLTLSSVAETTDDWTDVDENSVTSLDETNGVSDRFWYEEETKKMYEDNIGMNNLSVHFVSVKQNDQMMNESDIICNLTTKINVALRCVNVPTCLEMKSLKLVDVLLDENELSLYMGKSMAEKLCWEIKYLPRFSDIDYSAKRTIVPLQLNIWKELSLKEKEIARHEEDREDKKKRMNFLRLRQTLQCYRHTHVIEKFIQFLATNLKDKKIIQSFFLHIKQFLDGQSLLGKPEIHRELINCAEKYERARAKGGDLQIIRKSWEKANNKMFHNCFGIEHLSRETGQIYEAFQNTRDSFGYQMTTNTLNILRKLPNIAVEMLFCGHPLEILDGDSSNVPLTWIEAVFTQIKQRIGNDKTLFSISVLGIQGSGKSTLLNTMFGLQFAVGAGRCTRGVYMHLVPVNKENASLDFDFVIILDTEGLRSPEMIGEKIQHDNELATFVIGLSDVAIINIKGEAIAEMTDVLEIVVHSLVRFKLANETLNHKKSCLFVHQNVPSQNATIATLQGNQKVLNHLNEMTKHVAESENIADLTSFLDVISFDIRKHILYIPDLWKGSPPMAPVSLDYTNSVRAVAKLILNDMSKEKSFLNVADTFDQLKNLWECILTEDFVFNFRNVQDVRAFRLLDKEFQNILWELETLKMNYLQNSINQRLFSCKINKELERTASEIINIFGKELDLKKNACINRLSNFAVTSDLKNYIDFWKQRKEIELVSVAMEIKSEVERKIEAKKEKCRVFLSRNLRLAEFKTVINKKAMDFAGKAKHMLSEEGLESEFENLWDDWLNDFAPIGLKNDDIKSKLGIMKKEIIDEMYKKYISHTSLITNMLHDVTFSDDYDDHDNFRLIQCVRCIEIEKQLSKVALWKVPGRNIEKEKANSAKTAIRTILGQIERYFKSLENNEEYNSTQFSSVLKTFVDGFNNYNQNKEVNGYTITPALEIQVLKHVLKYSYQKFAAMIIKFEENNTLRSRIQNDCYLEVKSLFFDTYNNKEYEVLVTNIICIALKPKLRCATIEGISGDVFKTIAVDHFDYRKSPLLRQVMIHLAEQEDFNQFILFLTAPEWYVQIWLEEYTKNIFCTKDDKNVSLYENCVKRNLTNVMEDVRKAAVRGTSKELTSPEKLQEWITSFNERLLTENIPADITSILTELDFKLLNFSQFLENLEEGLSIIEGELYKDFQKLSFLDIPWESGSPFEQIRKYLWKCAEVCPWCKEPCFRNSSSDKHSAIQHRPNGIVGLRNSDSGTLAIETCNFKVQTTITMSCGYWCSCAKKDTKQNHACNRYKSFMPDWDISPSKKMETSPYWFWFMNTFSEELAEYYQAKEPQLTTEMKCITKKEALQSLDVYNM